MSSRRHLQRGEVQASSPLISCLLLGYALAREGGRKCFRVRGLFPRKTKKHIVPQNEHTVYNKNTVYLVRGSISFALFSCDAGFTHNVKC